MWLQLRWTWEWRTRDTWMTDCFRCWCWVGVVTMSSVREKKLGNDYRLVTWIAVWWLRPLQRLTEYWRGNIFEGKDGWNSPETMSSYLNFFFCVPPHPTFLQFIVTKRCNRTADPWWNSFQQISLWGAECRESQNEGNACCFLISLLGKLLSFLTLATLLSALVTLSFCLRFFLLWNRNQQQCVFKKINWFWK